MPARPLAVLSVLFLLLPNVAVAKKIEGDRLFAPDHLIDVEIRLKDSDWDTLRHQARNMGAMFGGGVIEDPFTYFKADLLIDGVEIKSVGLRKKGLFGSADNERPSLKIKFDEFEKQDPVKGLSRLTFNNNKQDTSQLSQLLTYQLFRKAGIHAPRSNFARVTVNGRFLGIYSHVESIDKPFLKESFDDKSGNLYEGTLTDFHPKTVNKIEVKTNENENDRAQLIRIAEILAADGPLDLDQIGTVIDIDNFMRYWAMEGMLRFWDGYASNQNNFHVYFNPKNQLGYFIPWGADGSFTKDGGPFGMFGGGRGPTSFYAQSILCNKLYHTDGIPDRYKAATLKLLDDVWNEDELLAEIDRAEKLITPHLHGSQQSTPQEINNVRDFIRGRRDIVKKELAKGPFQIAPEPRKPMYQVDVGTLVGTFKTTWQDQPAFGQPGNGMADVKLKIDGNDVALIELTATATEFRMPQFGRTGGGPGFGGPGPGGPPPSGAVPPPAIMITIAGQRAKDSQPISMSFMIDRDTYRKAGSEPVSVNGRLTEGQQFGFGFGGPQGKSLNGELTLTKTGSAAGEEVSGSLNLRVVEVHGGFFNGPPPGGGPRPGGRPQPGGPPGNDRRRPPMERDEAAKPSTTSDASGIVTFTTQEDHRQMQQQLGITKLRPGPTGNPSEPDAPNTGES